VSSPSLSTTTEAAPPADPGRRNEAAPRRSRSPGRIRRYVAVVVVLAIAVLLVAVFVVPLLTRSTGSSPGATGTDLTYSGARPVADGAASHFEGGGWTLLLATGLVSPVSESFPLNTTALTSIGCAFTPAVVLTSLTVPGDTGNRSSGASPAWEFGYSNSQDTIALVSVIEGQGTVLGTVTGFTCALAAQEVTPVPGNVMDSSRAVEAVAAEVQVFLSAHANASADYALLGAHAAGGHRLGPEWSILYSTCPLSSSASGTGAEFNATVNATSGAIVNTATSPDASCSSGTSVLTIRNAAASESPLATAMSPVSAMRGVCRG